jgi:hypothetical protein
MASRKDIQSALGWDSMWRLRVSRLEAGMWQQPMRKILNRCVKALVALSIAGVCTAIVGLVIGNDSVYWAGLLLAAPLYILYVLPMALLLLGIFTVAAICSFVGKR